MIDSITRTLFNKNPIDADDYNSMGLPGILEHYFARSEKLKFAYKWLVQPLGSQYRTQIIVDVNIPIQ